MRAYRARRGGGKTGSKTINPRFSDAPSWIAWDGEGHTEHAPGCPGTGHKECACPHLYTLLAHSRGARIYRREGLSTRECFDFLIDEAVKFPGAQHCIFSGGYDVNMILRDFDREQLLALKAANENGFVTKLGNVNFGVGHRPRKTFSVARLKENPWMQRDNGTWYRNVEYQGDAPMKMRVWDVWGFFQASFVDACHEWFCPRSTDCPLGADCPDVAKHVPLYREIVTMKKARAAFKPEERERIEAYCFAECEALEKLMVMVSEAEHDAQVFPRRHDGVGAISSAVLSAQGVKRYKQPPPEHLDSPIASAFAGGRIEIAKIGNIGPAHDYDIRSAYPAGLMTLPSLDGVWRKSDRIEGFCLSHIRWSFPHDLPWYPLFYRTRGGSILFPCEGEGWYWRPEAEAALEFADKLGGLVEVIETWKLHSEGEPFAWVAPMYEQRREWKAAGRPAQRILKLSLNGTYGKTAQQLGGTATREPPFFSLSWAGWTTSFTRAKLVCAALHDPDAIVAFATDGLFTTRELPIATPKGPGDLGSWEKAYSADGLVIAQAGVYWGRRKEEWHARYRGFDKEYLETPERVLAAWARGDWHLDVPVTRFIGMGAALVGESCWPYWRTWRTIDRTLDLRGLSAKRMACLPKQRPHKKAVDLRPSLNIEYEALGNVSEPYRVAWKDWHRKDSLEVIDGAPSYIFETEAEEAFL